MSKFTTAIKFEKLIDPTILSPILICLVEPG